MCFGKSIKISSLKFHVFSSICIFYILTFSLHYLVLATYFPWLQQDKKIDAVGYRLAPLKTILLNLVEELVRKQ